MYPWDVLEIEETDNKREIKKAYARLLKVYRPDSHPEKFQEINQAYQFALKLIDSHPLQESEIIEDELPVYEHVTDEVSVKENVIDCKAQINNLLEQKAHVFNDLNKWAFLKDFFQDMSFEEKDHVARYTFQKCYEVNINHVQQQGVITINVSTLRFLDATLNWTEQWQDYQFDFPTNCYRFNYNLLEGNSDFDINHFSVAPKKRLGAFFIDVAVVAIPIYLIDYFTKLEVIFAIYVGSFILYQFILEGILKQQTLGCRINGYKIVNAAYSPNSFRQTMLRLFYFHVILFPLYFDYDGFQNKPLIPLLSYLIIYPAYILVFLFGKRFLHDEMSSTKAVPLR